MSNANKRWLLWTPAAAVVLTLALLTIDDSQNSCFLNVCRGGASEGATRQREAASIAVRSRWAELRALDDIASATRLLPAPAPVAGPAALVFGADISQPVREKVRRAIDAERDARAPWHSRGRVAIVVASDTAQLIGPGNERKWRLGRSQTAALRVLPPSPLTQGRCVTVVRLGARGLRDGIVFDPNRPWMDACAFVDAFGAPGQALAAALDSSRWIGAGIFSPSLPDSIRRIRHRSVLTAAGFGALDETPCLGRDTIACAALITDQLSARVTPGTFSEPRGLDIPFPVGASNAYARSAAMLLDAIVAEIGPDAFEKIWRSDAPFAEAYAASNGRPLHELAYDAVRRTYGYRDDRTHGFGANFLRTPLAFAGSSVLVIAFIAGLAWLTARMAPRTRATS